MQNEKEEKKMLGKNPVFFAPMPKSDFEIFNSGIFFIRSVNRAINQSNRKDLQRILASKPKKTVEFYLNFIARYLSKEEMEYFHLPLGVAIINNNSEMVKILLNFNADPNFIHRGVSPCTPYQLMKCYKTSISRELIAMVIDAGARKKIDKNSENFHQQTRLLRLSHIAPNALNKIRLLAKALINFSMLECKYSHNLINRLPSLHNLNIKEKIKLIPIYFAVEFEKNNNSCMLNVYIALKIASLFIDQYDDEKIVTESQKKSIDFSAFVALELIREILSIHHRACIMGSLKKNGQYSLLSRNFYFNINKLQPKLIKAMLEYPTQARFLRVADSNAKRNTPSFA